MDSVGMDYAAGVVLGYFYAYLKIAPGLLAELGETKSQSLL